MAACPRRIEADLAGGGRPGSDRTNRALVRRALSDHSGCGGQSRWPIRKGCSCSSPPNENCAELVSPGLTDKLIVRPLSCSPYDVGSNLRASLPASLASSVVLVSAVASLCSYECAGRRPAVRTCSQDRGSLHQAPYQRNLPGGDRPPGARQLRRRLYSAGPQSLGWSRCARSGTWSPSRQTSISTGGRTVHGQARMAGAARSQR